MTINKLTPIQRFFRLLKPDSKEIGYIYIYAAFNGLVYLSVPLGIQAIINFIQAGQVSTSWLILVFLVMTGIGITGFLQLMQLHITENIQQKIFTRAAFEFAYRIPRIRLDALYNYYAPELTNRFFDTLTVQKGFSKLLLDFSTAVLQVIFGLILLALYHPFFILFGLVLILLVYTIFWLTGRRGLETSLHESKYKYKVAHWLEELARLNQTFKLAGENELTLGKTDMLTSKYLSSRKSHFKILVQQYKMLIAFKIIVAAGLLLIGGLLVIKQQMNIGQFVAAEIIILLIINSVEKIVISLDTIYDVLTALEKIGQVTDLELENTDGLNIDTQNGLGIKIELKGLNYTYPDSSKKIITDLNMMINAGEKVVITGTNGSGKSTLLYIISGLYEQQSGALLYNDLPIGNLNINSLRSIMGTCLSNELLFDGNIIDNITMGRKNISFEDIEWVTEKLKLKEYIKSLPKGYHTHLNPGNDKMPSSIAQKIFLARSIVIKPKLLLLENVFKSIDQEDKTAIIDFILDQTNKWTVIAVSADNYLLSKCDKIMLFRKNQNLKIGDYLTLKNEL